MSHKNFNIQKASGKEESFSMEKLRNSLMRSKATYEEAELIIDELKSQLVPGMSTNKLYSMAYRLLKKQNNHNASRYYLKRAMMELGPSGYPFEKYIAALFQREGFQTQTGIILEGKCVTHEIDVKAKKDQLLYLMECKYKNQGGVSVDVKVPLYINSRFEDVLDNRSQLGHFSKFQGWIVTNSRFTDDAKAYARCKGIELLGWDYPNRNALKDRIDASGLYPLTCMSSLTEEEKRALLEEEIVLAKDLLMNEKLVLKIGVHPHRIKQIMNEANSLCVPSNED